MGQTTEQTITPLAINVEAAEKPHIRIMWGQPHRVKPKFVNDALGDGRKLLVLTPINTRPNYYLIRVDSAWALGDGHADGETIHDHIDEIYEAIEAEFGCSSEEDETTGEPIHNPWPALSSDSGSSWGEVSGRELDELLEVRA